MNREFTVKDVLSALSYKGLPFPGLWVPPKPNQYVDDGYTIDGPVKIQKTQAKLGATLRKKDAKGRWYYMPVTLIYQGKEYELPNVVIKISGQKTIVSTPMVGRSGTVKELININDYEISVTGAVVSDDFPEDGISELNKLYNINESIGLKCALTDIFMQKDDQVVIKNIELAEMRGIEHVQLFTLNMLTDKNFELTIE